MRVLARVWDRFASKVIGSFTCTFITRLAESFVSLDSLGRFIIAQLAGDTTGVRIDHFAQFLVADTSLVVTRILLGLTETLRERTYRRLGSLHQTKPVFLRMGVALR